MENTTRTEPKLSVHGVLAHSYAAAFLFFMIGVSLDLLFKLEVFQDKEVATYGFAILVLGTILVFWAQRTSRKLNKENITKDTFMHGPYRYTRNPTHWGLFLLTLGFGMVVNAVFVVVSSLVSLLVGKFVFLRKEEELLAKKYGAPYQEYQKIVKF